MYCSKKMSSFHLSQGHPFASLLFTSLVQEPWKLRLKLEGWGMHFSVKTNEILLKEILNLKILF